MATLYFDNAADDDWSNVLNWWEDEACTIQASAIPTASDDAVCIGSYGITWNSGPDAEVSTYTHNDGSYFEGLTITATNGCTFNNSVAVGATVNGDCVFYQSSSNNYGTINGNCTFWESSVNYSTVNGNCEFRDYSCTGGGTIYGNCVFRDYTGHNYNCTIDGDATFYDFSYNAGSVGNGNTLGNAHFYDYSFNTGTVFLTAYFHGFSYGFWSGYDVYSSPIGSAYYAIVDLATETAYEFFMIGNVAGAYVEFPKGALAAKALATTLSILSMASQWLVYGPSPVFPPDQMGVNGSSILGVV